MARTVDAPRAAGEITFELERFELEHDRLELIGRWFGVRGRRFMRPTLTRVGELDRARVLAELEHKPWPAEDGELWEAAFPWHEDAAVGNFELSVTPDITIQLPSPSGRLTRPRRLNAIGRRPAITGSPRKADEEAQDAPARPPSELELLRARFARVKQELEQAQLALAEGEQQLDAARAEVSAIKAERDATAAELAEARAAQATLEAGRTVLAAASDHLTSDRDRLAAQHAQLVAKHAELEAQRDGLLAARDEQVAKQDRLREERDRVAAERDRLGTQLAQLTAERDQAVAELRSRLEQAERAAQEATLRRDEAINARGAALVMRRAVVTPPNYERSGTWWHQALAIVALVAVVFAILIVAHVL